MSERLTEDALEWLSIWADTDLADATVSAGDIRALIAEVRQHRAAALSDEERAALRFARVELDRRCPIFLGERRAQFRSALDVLDKLLAAAGGGK